MMQNPGTTTTAAAAAATTTTTATSSIQFPLGQNTSRHAFTFHSLNFHSLSPFLSPLPFSSAIGIIILWRPKDRVKERERGMNRMAIHFTARYLRERKREREMYNSHNSG